MNNVMVDNWLLEDAVINLQRNPMEPSKSLSDLLMAIVLWDNVYYPRKGHSTWWTEVQPDLQDYLLPIEDNGLDGLQEALGDVSRVRTKSPEQQDEGDGTQEPLIVSSSAFRYLRLSSQNNCDYLPVRERQEYLAKNLLFTDSKVRDMLVKIGSQKMLDKQVKAYVEESLKALLDMPKVEFKMPVLTSYILKDTPVGMSPVEYAFHLRQEGAVIRYREYLAELANTIERQDWKEYRRLIGCATDAIQGVLTMDKGRIGSINAGIFPTLSATLETPYFTASTDPQKLLALKLENFKRRKYHLTFLRDLTKHGINRIEI